MQDRRISISITGITAAALWGLGGALVLVDLTHSHRLAPVGLYFAFLGACLWIRRLVWKATEYVAGREVNAFELGQDSANQKPLHIHRG